MTEMRDARLKRALEAADEDPQGPSAATRANVLRAASGALAQQAAPARPWWQLPQWRVPLNAAFASMAIAVLITLMWQGQEVPGARPESASADRAAPAAAPSPAPASATTTPAAPLPAPATTAPAPATPSARPDAAPSPAPLPQLEAPRAAARAPAHASKDAPPAGAAAERAEPPPKAAPAEPLAKKAESQRRDESRAAREEAAPAATSPSPFQGPAPADSNLGQSSAADARVRAQGSIAPAAPAAAPPSTQAALARRAPWEDWSEARIESPARTATVTRARAFHLAELLYGVLNSPAATGSDEAMPTRITLSRMGITLGVLELGPSRARWSPQDGPSRTLQPRAEALRLLEQEAQRLANN
ncbi:hypothetical protein [Ramlibacter albus]|uniref:Uncharacterized protein n=1 Tax=Ramlibacter albus TaxID=2079448 RepID=A0A923M3E6_9BURK|nr:hypothetical protein [Ramlibacter albus]MBC5763200.1 hypothetical protein [Ramlibacter albus]